MLTADDRRAVAAMTRVLRIIIVVMIMGVGAFLVVVFANVDDEQPVEPNAAPMPLIAAAFAGMAMTASFFVPRMMAAQQRSVLARRPVEDRGPDLSADGENVRPLIANILTRRIVAGAILESAAFFNTFAYMTERQTYSLAIVLVLLGALATLFPVQTMIEELLQRELRTVRELRNQQGRAG